MHSFILPVITHWKPIPGGQNYFTDGSSKGCATICGPKHTEAIMTSGISAQCSEFNCSHSGFTAHSFRSYQHCDSAYVVNVASGTETATIKSTLELELLIFKISKRYSFSCSFFSYFSYVFSYIASWTIIPRER